MTEIKSLGQYNDELVQGIEKRSPKAMGKVITFVENKPEEAHNVLDRLHFLSGHAYVIGITGTPGVGKSTLVAKIVDMFRKKDLTVGIIAVDPTSPFSGGAVLGDRIRMGDLSIDDGVFIRSIATRGALGGLSRACNDVITVMDAFGKDIIMVETVGVGQDEVDIVKSSDACLLVMMPGMGDDVQILKAGLIEIADIFVVNKADYDGSERLSLGIKMMLELSGRKKEWEPPIFQTIASDNKGVAELVEGINSFREFQERNGLLGERRRLRVKKQITSSIENEIFRQVKDLLNSKFSIDEIIDDVVSKRKSPYRWAREVMEYLSSNVVS